MKLKEIGIELIKAIIVLLISILAGVLMMVAAFSIPLSADDPNVVASMKQLEDEGFYPELPYVRTCVEVEDMHNNSRMDNYTDQLIIKLSIVDPTGNLLKVAMGKRGIIRYWCGFIAIVRPLLTILDYGQMRMLNVLLQLFVTAVLAWLLAKRKGSIWGFWVLTFYCLQAPYALGMSYQYSCMFYIAVVAGILFLLGEKWLMTRCRAFLFFMVVGCATSFFDFLTSPLLAWALLLLIWLIVDENSDNLMRLKRTIGASVYWFAGYAVMWAGRWVVSAIVLGIPISDQLGDKISVHTGVEGAGHTYKEALFNNFSIWVNEQTLFILALWMIWFLVKMVKVIKNRRGIDCGNAPMLSLVAVAPLCWYYVMRGHTAVHAMFTYRLFSVSIMAVLAVVIFMVDVEDAVGSERSLMNPIVLIGALLAVQIVAFCISKSGRVEAEFSHNCNYEPSLMEMMDGDEVTWTVTPVKEDVKKYGVGLAGEGEGYFLITYAIDHRKPKTVKAEFATLNPEGAVFYLVDGTAKVKEQISITVQTVSQGGAGYILTTDNETAMPEASEYLVDLEPKEGRVSQWMTYGNPLSRMDLITFHVICLGILWVLVGNILYLVNVVGGAKVPSRKETK